MIPRLVIAGTSSGAGKTTVATGLMAALSGRGHTVGRFKVGPHLIDPTYHALATGRPGRNLDAFLSGPELIAPLFRHGADGSEVAIVEGVMGLFDGASGRGELASTAHVAKLLEAPVVLVVDAAAMARSVAAIVHGYSDYDPELRIAGVILNRVGSDWHEELLREAIEPLGIPVLGALRRDASIATPERHLGLVPAAEREVNARAAIASLAGAVGRGCDLEAIVAVARRAPASPGPAWAPTVGAAQAGSPVRIAVARGPAFSFHYEENLELLRAAGAELVDFDPLGDEQLPPRTRALYLAGGFPEVFGAELSANWALRAEVAAFSHAGRPIVAECGGLLYLVSELDGLPMCGAIEATARMSDQLTLGYRDAEAVGPSPLWRSGERVRGHEFHYSHVEPGVGDPPAWILSARGRSRPEGFVAGGVHASYLHTHWAATPVLAARLVAAAGALVPAGASS